MNTNLLNIVQQIIDQYGEGVLAEPRRVSALFGDLARDIPAPQRNAFARSLEYKFVEMLKNVSEADRSACKQELAKRLNEQEGLDLNLCRNTVELLATVLFGPQETAAQEESSPAQAAYDRAYALFYDTEEDEQALAELAKAIGLDPDFEEAHRLRGTIHQIIGRHDLAVADFTQAIRIEPYLFTFAERGTSRMMCDDWDGALKDLNEAIRLNQDSPYHRHTYNYRGKVYCEMGQWDMAISDFNSAIKLDPENYLHYFFRGHAYKEAGLRNLAIQDFNKVLSFDLADDDEDAAQCAQYAKELLQELQ